MCGTWGMTKPLVSDDLWSVVEPVLPPTRSPGTRGHPPVPNRVAPNRYHLRAQNGHPLGVLPAGAGLLWHDTLEPLTSLAARRRLGAAAPHPAAASGGCWQDRLAAGQRGRVADSGQRRQKGGATTGPNPTDRGKPGTH